jgi:manganese transport protein
MPSQMNPDPYILLAEKTIAAPSTFSGRLRHLGPSLILSAAIVGSGELIATTTLGAKAGFVTFWLILLSCVIKVMIQLEFGKHTVGTGQTAMQLFGKLPGPKFGKARWSVWTIFIMAILKLVQLGGILGGVAITMNMAFPLLSVPVMALLIAVITALLVYKGYYGSLEKLSLYMIAFFTLFTFASLYFLKFTPYHLSYSDVLSGLTFQFPKAALAFAFGAFGITGVGGDEIIHYNYWCLEKGYGSHVGPKNDTPEWKARAAGWIKVMQLDAFLAMLIYTTVTAAFYLLGAAVLHKQGLMPEGYDMIETLSAIFTESLGPWSKSFFLAGSFVILFSTLYSACGAWARQISDIIGQFGWINFFDQTQRKKAIAWFAWLLPLIWAALFLFIKLPTLMVITGGIVGSLVLLLVVGLVIYFRIAKIGYSAPITLIYDVLLWISAITIFGFCLYGLVRYVI